MPNNSKKPINSEKNQDREKVKLETHDYDALFEELAQEEQADLDDLWNYLEEQEKEENTN